MVEMRRVEEEEPIIRIYCMKKSIFSERKGQIPNLSIFNGNFKRIIYRTIFRVKSVY